MPWKPSRTQGTVLGVLAAEKRVTGKLLDLTSAKESGGYGGSGEKMFLLNSYVPLRTNLNFLFYTDPRDPC